MRLAGIEDFAVLQLEYAEIKALLENHKNITEDSIKVYLNNKLKFY